jgi:hypothetical protein
MQKEKLKSNAYSGKDMNSVKCIVPVPGKRGCVKQKWNFAGIALLLTTHIPDTELLSMYSQQLLPSWK